MNDDRGKKDKITKDSFGNIFMVIAELWDRNTFMESSLGDWKPGDRVLSSLHASGELHWAFFQT